MSVVEQVLAYQRQATPEEIVERLLINGTASFPCLIFDSCPAAGGIEVFANHYDQQLGQVLFGVCATLHWEAPDLFEQIDHYLKSEL